MVFWVSVATENNNDKPQKKFYLAQVPTQA